LLVFLERAPSPDLVTGEGGLDLEKLGDAQFNWKGKKEQGAGRVCFLQKIKLWIFDMG